MSDILTSAPITLGRRHKPIRSIFLAEEYPEEEILRFENTQQEEALGSSFKRGTQIGRAESAFADLFAL